jgi:hypothetical protein
VDRLRSKPARIIEAAGRNRDTPRLRLNVESTGDPHSGQKPRSTVLPLSPRIWWNFSLPVNVTAVAGNTIKLACPDPVSRWQSRHWHWKDFTGSAAIS